MIILDSIKAEIIEHAESEKPTEACGLIVVFKGRHKYIRCTNLSTVPDTFIISPEDYANAEDFGTVICVVHSHPFSNSKPSQADLVSLEKDSIPWVIYSCISKDFSTTYPSGYTAPLYGRQFSFGVLDCLTMIRDVYKEDLGILLKDDPIRAPKWWLSGQNLYVDRIEEWGFEVVEDYKPYDILLMQVSAPVPDHAAVLLPDNTIAHHFEGRLSSKDVYGGWYRKVTTHICRHKTRI